MRAAVTTSPGQPLTVTTVDDPTPGPHDVVVQVDACGICGSDLHFADSFAPDGAVMGHEFCGTVVARGAQATQVDEGQLVAGLSIRTCGACLPCRSGRPRECEARALIGIDSPGAFAEYVALHEHDALVLPEGLDHRHGALVEPLAIGLHTVEQAGVSLGDDVLVIGAGPIGAAVTVWLQHAGAGHVVVSDPVEHRRELAEAVGATATIDPTALDVGGAFADLTGAPPPIVIECVGIPGMIQHACDVAADSARIVIAGVCMQPDTLFPALVLMKEVEIRFASYYRANAYPHTIEMLAAGRIDPLALVTGEVGLDDLPERFESLKTPTTDCKVLLRPSP